MENPGESNGRRAGLPLRLFLVALAAAAPASGFIATRDYYVAPLNLLLLGLLALYAALLPLLVAGALAHHSLRGRRNGKKLAPALRRLSTPALLIGAAGPALFYLLYTPLLQTHFVVCVAVIITGFKAPITAGRSAALLTATAALAFAALVAGPTSGALYGFFVLSLAAAAYLAVMQRRAAPAAPKAVAVVAVLLVSSALTQLSTMIAWENVGELAARRVLFEMDEADSSRYNFYDIKLGPAGETLYLSNCAPRIDEPIHLLELDLTGGEPRFSTDTFTTLQQMALPATETAGNPLYASMYGGVAVVDRADLSLRKKCDTGNLVDLALAPDGTSLAALSEFVPVLSWLNPRTCAGVPVPLATNIPYQVICADRIKRCYVSGWWASSVISEIDASDAGRPQNTRSLFVGPYSMGMALDGPQERLFVARPLAASVDVIDTGSFTRIARLPSPPLVRAIAYSPEHDLLFLPSYYNGRIVIVRADTGETLGELKVGAIIREILWDSQRSALFVIDQNSLYRFEESDLHAAVSPRL